MFTFDSLNTKHKFKVRDELAFINNIKNTKIYLLCKCFFF